ncbi:hypothetical protein ABMC89_09130 [Sulfitobacter sp. HNIBRBA3233]|uniref:hypothetical protein n=1 Tax=Sulfitobacter marinivivus TaxID=3158558 RepID=UPI0032DE98B8
MWKKTVAAMLLLGLLTACNGASDLDDPAVPLGDFKLGHNIVVTPKTQKVPLGRELDKALMERMLKEAVDERFARYEGTGLYHFGISIESYFLAPPGVPVVAAPKSAMIIRLSVWDDAKNKKLTEKAHQLTVIESLDQGPLVGSGYTKSAEEQFKNLSQNAVKQIETYLVRRNEEEGWFGSAPVATATEEEPAAVEG